MGWYRVGHADGYIYTRLKTSDIDDRLCADSERLLNVIIEESFVKPMKALVSGSNHVHRIILSFLPQSHKDILEVRFTECGNLLLWI